MDKNKVIELISDAIYQLDPFGMDMDNYDNLCKNATKILYLAKEESQKSDWISVEDGLPPCNEKVLVYGKNGDYDITERINCDDYRYDKNGFIKYLCVTHWCKIDKLEK